MIRERVRDLTLIEMDEKILVIAVDSCGGVGQKEMDELKVDPYFVGRLTARVCIMEVLSAGAKVLTIINGVTNEFDTTGEKIFKGITDELIEANIDKIPVNGSSEENFKTVNTGVVITVIGVVEKENIKVSKDLSGLKVGLVGLPKVGSEIKLPYDPDIISYKDLYTLLTNDNVIEIIPIGSKGIIGELKQINCEVELSKNVKMDIHKSAGPATCVLVFYCGKLIDGVTEIGDVRR
ncbi:MAG: alpha-ribazole-5-phosphate synthase [Alkaliphilus sp.]|nr:alpha-ribazole-5-phosphate synthase [bacterium AH-315-E09]PHS30323.1 MAG: alpha-ribazole-5-phosphate synthase [Alkaliphilus sp.]